MSIPSKFSTSDLLHAIREIPKTDISRTEKNLLMILLSCMNCSNTTWYGVESLAKFACMGVSTVMRAMQTLEQKSFIHIDRPAAYKINSTNKYHLNIDKILLYTRAADRPQPVDNLPQELSTALQNDSRPPVKMNTDRPSKRTWKKERKKEIKKKEDAREEHALLPADFEPSKACADLVRELGFSGEIADEEFELFKKYYTKNKIEFSNWDLAFKCWLKRAASIRKSKEALKIPEKIDPYKAIEMQSPRYCDGGVRPIGQIIGGMGL